MYKHLKCLGMYMVFEIPRDQTHVSVKLITSCYLCSELYCML